jgi:hypothetical protein
MKRLLMFLMCVVGGSSVEAQTAEDFGNKVFQWLLKGDDRLCRHYVPLRDYLAFIQKSARTDEEKDQLKGLAVDDYPRTRRAYEQSCADILGVFAIALKEGYTLKFESVVFHATEPNGQLGFLELRYLAVYGKDQTRDGLQLEVIQTEDGWMILDGFFEL